MSQVPLNHLLKIGSDALQTVAQTLSGAVNELKTAISGKSTVSISSSGSASWSTVKSQNVTIDSVSTSIDGTAYMEGSILLDTDNPAIATFTNAIITANSVIDVYVSDWGVVPENVSVAAGTCVVTLPTVDTAATVTVRIYIK